MAETTVVINTALINTAVINTVVIRIMGHGRCGPGGAPR